MKLIAWLNDLEWFDRRDQDDIITLIDA